VIFLPSSSDIEGFSLERQDFFSKRNLKANYLLAQNESKNKNDAQQKV
jgi:hypothetical protein